MARLSPQFIGESPVFHRLMDKISDSAALDRPVLICGERGSGKKLMASRLHFLSPRWEKSYVAINCAAYDEESMESFLFERPLEDGSLFLNHIEQMPVRLQERLVTTLFEEEAIQDLPVRVFAASQQDLPTLVAAGEICADFLDYVSFDVVHVPPLRARVEDVPLLASFFARKMVTQLGAERFPGFGAEALTRLTQYGWPGNITELRTVVERAIGEAFLVDETLNMPIETVQFAPFVSPWSASDSQLSDMASDMVLRPDLSETVSDQGFHDQVQAFSRRLILQALERQNHHQGKTAMELGLSYHQLRGLLRKYAITRTQLMPD